MRELRYAIGEWLLDRYLDQQIPAVIYTRIKRAFPIHPIDLTGFEIADSFTF